MKLTTLQLDEIRPYENNPRLNQGAIDTVAESITRFGIRQPIVVDKQKVIICGHTRWLAAKKLGLKTFPVHIATDMTPEKVKAYRIIDNRTTELSSWDFDKLREEIGELELTAEDMELLKIDIGAWPELDVPDLESMKVDTDLAAGSRAKMISVGKYRIPITEAEYDALVGSMDGYASDTGTFFGFGRWLLEKAGFEVRQEAANVEGQTIPTL
jgi:hypothetical protein